MPQEIDFDAAFPAPFAPMLKPITVTVPMCRKITGLGNTTIWGLIKDRKLEVARVGGRTLVIFSSLEALLAPNKAK